MRKNYLNIQHSYSFFFIKTAVFSVERYSLELSEKNYIPFATITPKSSMYYFKCQAFSNRNLYSLFSQRHFLRLLQKLMSPINLQIPKNADNYLNISTFSSFTTFTSIFYFFVIMNVSIVPRFAVQFRVSLFISKFEKQNSIGSQLSYEISSSIYCSYQSILLMNVRQRPMPYIDFKFLSDAHFDRVLIPGQQISVIDFKKILSKKYGIKEEQLALKYTNIDAYIDITDLLISGSQIYGQKVRSSRQSVMYPSQYHFMLYKQQKEEFKPTIQYISRQDLMLLSQKSKFYVIRSCNQDNINVAKAKSRWATTRTNQRKLVQSFNNFKAVFLIFTTRKSQSFQGVAKMVTLPQSVPDKSIWKNVQKINLGGNFIISWVRDGDVMYQDVAHYLNKFSNQLLIQSRDCQQISIQLGKILCSRFPDPDPSLIPPPPQPEPVKVIQQKVIAKAQIDYDLIVRVCMERYGEEQQVNHRNFQRKNKQRAQQSQSSQSSSDSSDQSEERKRKKKRKKERKQKRQKLSKKQRKQKSRERSRNKEKSHKEKERKKKNKEKERQRQRDR